MTFSTPVALIIFNRPDTTARVFAEIARVRPATLLVIADGPREGRAGEADACDAARSAVLDHIDWTCDVRVSLAESNMGCRARVTSAIDWVFSQVEEAIIFEDDCLPHPTFFQFSQELLERYRDDERVMAISGNNFQRGRRRTEFSYYFSRYPHNWGWATWRRAWAYFDANITHWPELRETPWLEDLLGDSVIARYWRDVLDNAAADDSVWDYQWMFACWSQNGFAVLPEVNLVSNIGFDESSTHTTAASESILRVPPGEMVFPLSHPPYMVWESEADAFTNREAYLKNLPSGLYGRLRHKVASLISTANS